MQPKMKKAGAIIALISIPIFIGAIDLTVVSAVLPHVVTDLELPLQTGMDNAAWMVSGYLLAYSVSVASMGRLSDILGRRRVYLAALVVFAIGSYLVAVAGDWPLRLVLRSYYLLSTGRPDISYMTLYILIAARMIQAFGAGTMVPVGMALVADLYPEGRRARPLGVIAAVDTAGWVVGHLYGGIVVRYWPWKTIFWINIPFCILAFIVIWLLLRGIPQDLKKMRMDWLGAALITISLTLLNIGFGTSSEGSSTASVETQTGLPSYALPMILGALAFLGLFIWRQARAKDPLIDLRLFKLQNYIPASLTNLLVGIGLFIAIADVPLFINSLIATSLEQGAWDSGWMLCALTVPMALATVPGGWLSDRRGYRFPAVLGLVLAVGGLLTMTSWQMETSYGQMVPSLVVAGIGFGLTMAPIADAVVSVSPSDQRGTSSALVIVFRLIGMTLGVSGITTYVLHRVDVLGERMLAEGSSLGETANIGLLVVEQSISETFIIAGAVAAFAILPALFMKTTQNKGE